MASQNGALQLGACALAIYTMFLIWGLLQEKITSTVYRSGDGLLDPFAEGEHFEYGVLLNAIQAMLSCAAASTYLLYRERRRHHAPGPHGVAAALGVDVLTPDGCARALVMRGKREADTRPPKGLSRWVSPLLQRYLLISALQSTGSYLGLLSLRHLSFPAITLAKSSKLVPVLLMNVVLYRRHFAAYKYVVVVLVTLGVWMFMALGKSRSSSSRGGGNSAMGIALLGTHLLLDGAVNSTQDELFATYGTAYVSGTQMMLVMNAISATYMTAALLVPEGLGTALVAHMRLAMGEWLHPHWMAHLLLGGLSSAPRLSLTPQLLPAVQFLVRHPDAAVDVLAYGLAGAAGQIAIFETLARFGSLTLVSITVTRKLFTMLLSILVYQHHMRAVQWLGVAVVFAGLFIELRAKQRQSAAPRLKSQ
ncbi:UDP-galactose transporter [Malassezia sp. CBS 17886]|nr:UDP-galactose transporter [Malassezia sp. CBS 17886]